MPRASRAHKPAPHHVRVRETRHRKKARRGEAESIRAVLPTLSDEFSESEQETLRHLWSKTLPKVLSEAARCGEVGRGSALAKHALKWFGPLDQDELKTLGEGYQRMLTAIQTRVIRLEPMPVDAHPTTVGRVQVSRLIPARQRNLIHLRMNGVTRKGRGSMTVAPFKRSELLMTIVHELSHLILHTDDVVIDGARAYGRDGALRVARAGMALTHAPCYEMFAGAIAQKL